jgi:hypothetical protein
MSQTAEKMFRTRKRTALPAHLLAMHWQLAFSGVTKCFPTPTRLYQTYRGGLMPESLRRDEKDGVRCKTPEVVYLLLELTAQAKLMIWDACKNI